MNVDCRRSFLRHVAVPAACLCSCLLVAATARAQQPAGAGPAGPQAAARQSAGTLGMIIVTATRHATNIQQTPMAISAATGHTLAAMGITDSTQLAQIAPDLTFRPNPDGGSEIVVRDIQSSGEPTTGLYYGEIPVIGSVGVTSNAGGTTPDVRLYDVQRVEVLRGPQGTLFGSSSMAGTVRILFNEPNLVRYDGAVDAEVTSVQNGGLGTEEQGMLNLPLISNLLGARAVVYKQHTGGWLGNSVYGLKNFNQGNAEGGRLELRLKPKQGVTIDLLAVDQRHAGFGPQWSYSTSRQGGPLYDQNLVIQTPQSDELQLYGATLDWDMGPVTLHLITSYGTRDMKFMFDYSPLFRAEAASATPTTHGCEVYENTGGAPCSATQLASYQGYGYSLDHIAAYQPQTTRNITQEVRLTSSGDTRLTWTVGGFFDQRNTDVVSQLNIVDPNNGIMYEPTTVTPITVGNVTRPPTTAYQRTIRDVLDQVAGYAQLTYAVTHKLDLTAGTRRFTYDDAVSGAEQVGQPLVGLTVQPWSIARTTYSGEVSKFGMDYKWTPDIFTYVSASQGFRPGGVNQVVGLPAALGPYKPDSLWDYELGVKSAWLNHRLIANADVFEIDWTNMQTSASTDNGSIGFVTNAGDVRVQGVELSLRAEPVNGLQLSASGSFTPARLVGNQVAPAGITVNGAGLNGDYVPNSPKVTAQLSAQYTALLNSNLDWLARIDSDYTGVSWTVFNHTNNYEQELPGYALENIRLGIENSDGRWGTYFFISNVLNKIGIYTKTYGITVGPSPALEVTSTMPRTFGIEANYHFSPN